MFFLYLNEFLVPMNKIIALLYLIGVTSFVISCENEVNQGDNNPCLIDKSVNQSYSLLLPSYADLAFPGNSQIFQDDINFIKGVYIINLGSYYSAFEIAEPNDCTNECGLPEYTEGRFIYTCGEITTEYDILGNKINAEEDDFNMRVYNTRVSNDGNTLYITY